MFNNIFIVKKPVNQTFIEQNSRLVFLYDKILSL